MGSGSKEWARMSSNGGNNGQVDELNAEPSELEMQAAISAIYDAALTADDATVRETVDDNGADDGDRSGTREAATTGAGVLGGEVARRQIADAVNTRKVIDVARRVASRKTAGMSDAQVLEFLGSNA